MLIKKSSKKYKLTKMTKSMVIDTIIGPYPMILNSQEEIDSIISKLRKVEKEKSCESVVVLKQNKQLGGSYEIVSKEEAIDGIKNPRRCEWYIEFYQVSFFEELKRRFETETEFSYRLSK